jgi:O-acetylserine/cysteine efflux transporter
LLAVFVVSMWGLGFTVMKPTLQQFPAIMLMAISFGATALVLAVAEKRRPQTSHIKAALIALFAVSLQAALIFSALAYLDASTSVLVAQLQVPVSFLWAWALQTEPFRPGKLLALLVAFAGVAVIAGLPENPPPVLPLLVLVIGGAAWGLGQALISKIGSDDGSVLLKRVAIHGAAQLVVFSAIIETGQIKAITTASPAAWAGLAFIALVTFALAYVIWFDLMRRNPVSSVTPFLMLMPVTSVVSSVVFLGERPGIAVLGGGALILAGLALSQGLFAKRPVVTGP